jgi:hypothetical protein
MGSRADNSNPNLKTQEDLDALARTKDHCRTRAIILSIYSGFEKNNRDILRFNYVASSKLCYIHFRIAR